MSAKKTVHNAEAMREIAAQAAASATVDVIAQPKVSICAFEVVGVTPLIQNAFSQKAIEEMLRKHMGLTVQREKKKPREVIENAIIRNMEGTVCMPVTAFKAAMLTAAGTLKTFDRAKTKLMVSLFIEGGAIPIKFSRMTPRMDMVRLSGMSRTPDVRFRPQFDDWSARLVIQYNDGLLQPQSIMDLLQRAGSVGVGEWRPEKRGVNGKFRIERAINKVEELDEIRKECEVPLRTPVIPEWALDMNIDPTTLAKIFSPDGDGEAEAPAETGAENAAE